LAVFRNTVAIHPHQTEVRREKFLAAMLPAGGGARRRR